MSATMKAVVFDADGTLFNSFELIMAAYRHVASIHGLVPPTAEEVRAQMGNPIPDIYKSFYPDFAVDKLLHANSEFIAANIHTSEAFEGMHDMLQDIADQGLKMAILTSGNHKVVTFLKHHNIDQYFSSVVHHERITNPKPDPEGLLLAAKECGVMPNEIVMVGDMTFDILAGKTAGALATIGLTHGFGKKEDLEQAGANYIVDNLPAVQEIIWDLTDQQTAE